MNISFSIIFVKKFNPLDILTQASKLSMRILLHKNAAIFQTENIFKPNNSNRFSNGGADEI